MSEPMPAPDSMPLSAPTPVGAPAAPGPLGAPLSTAAQPVAAAVPGGCTLHLPALGQTLPLAPGQTLLQALLQAGVRWPVSCRNGSCRACIGQLAAGRVRYTVAWPGLLPEEKAVGCVLPCVACAQTDVVLLGPGV